MSDAIELESRGIPTVTICLESFDKHSANQARLRGLAELPLVIVPDRTPKDVSEVFEVQAKKVVPLVEAALTSKGNH